MNDKSLELLANIKRLHEKFGRKLNTNQKWVIAYWQQIDKVSVKDGMVSVSDVLKATNPSHILDTVQLYKVLRGEMK
jgi:hypothetical protein